jgi:hypothetical protein
VTGPEGGQQRPWRAAAGERPRRPNSEPVSAQKVVIFSCWAQNWEDSFIAAEDLVYGVLNDNPSVNDGGVGGSREGETPQKKEIPP